jgi:hypothetical protein
MAKNKQKETPIEHTTVRVSNEVLKGDQVIIGIAPTLVEGKEYTVSADVATVLISKGFAVLKNKNK